MYKKVKQISEEQELKKQQRQVIKHEKFIIRMEETFGNEYAVLGVFKNVNTKILIRHNKCGYEWSPYPSNLFSGQSKCPKCSKKMKITTEEYREKIRTLTEYEYDVVGEFINVDTKVLHKHIECGYVWGVRPCHFVSNGSRCPRCKSSKGETKVLKYLQSINAEFATQHKMEECKNVYSLTFDFAIFKDKQLLGLIEYDGIQHFKPIEFFGGEKMYKYTKELDYIKDEYCYVYNVPLLRIPYWRDDEIENIVDIFLTKIKFTV